MSKSGTENCLLGIFGLEFSKTIVVFEISTLELFKIQFLAQTVIF